MKYLLDTNAVLYILQGKGNFEFLEEEETFFLSFITNIELLAFARDKEKAIIKQFINLCETIFIEETWLEEVIEIRQKLRLKIPDAIIAATAKNEQAVLITADKEMIKKVKKIGTAVINPLDLSLQ